MPTFDSRWSSVQLAGCKAPMSPPRYPTDRWPEEVWGSMRILTAIGSIRETSNEKSLAPTDANTVLGGRTTPPGFFDDPENPFPDPGGSRGGSIAGSRMSGRRGGAESVPLSRLSRGSRSSWGGGSGLSQRGQSQLERGIQSRMSGIVEAPPSHKSRILYVDVILIQY